jgi:hypothetical protein
MDNIGLDTVAVHIDLECPEIDIEIHKLCGAMNIIVLFE